VECRHHLGKRFGLAHSMSNDKWGGGGMLYVHCIPTEDILPQIKHTEGWDEDKSYLTLEKYGDTSRKGEYYFPEVE
jgi:hypothetical protein